MERKRVKEELRIIRFGKRNIDALSAELEQKRKRLLAIEAHTEITPASISRLKKRISSLEQELFKKISDQELLEARYDEAISTLDEIDQIIIREGYINGRQYADLGLRLGYSVRGIENRMQGIIKRLSELL